LLEGGHRHGEGVCEEKELAETATTETIGGATLANNPTISIRAIAVSPAQT